MGKKSCGVKICHLRGCLLQAQELRQELDNAFASGRVQAHKKRIEKALSCSCRDKSNYCVSGCEEGRFVKIRSECWAGRSSTSKDSSRPHKLDDWFQLPVEEFVNEDEGDPVGRFEHENEPFVAERCWQDSCSLHDGKPTWILGQDNPCTEEFHIRGPLCTVCEQGLTSPIPNSVRYCCRTHLLAKHFSARGKQECKGKQLHH